MWDIAAEQGLYTPGDVKDFTATFSDGEYSHKYYSGRRMWGVFRLLAPSANYSAEYGNLKTDVPYPFAVPVDKAVTPQDVMRVMRDWYEGRFHCSPHLLKPFLVVVLMIFISCVLVSPVLCKALCCIFPSLIHCASLICFSCRHRVQHECGDGGWCLWYTGSLLRIYWRNGSGRILVSGYCGSWVYLCLFCVVCVVLFIASFCVIFVLRCCMSCAVAIFIDVLSNNR